MELSVEVEAARLMQAFREVGPVLRKSTEAMVRAGAKLAVRKAIEMTPPFDMRNADGSLQGDTQSAKKRGENAIKTDAFGGRRGGTIKRSGIFFVANEAMLRKFQERNPGGEIERLFVRKDGSVWATEKRHYVPNASISDMDAHHARYWKNGRMSSGGTRDRAIGRNVFIDRMVIGKGAKARWLKERYKRVGYLSAGWLDAANALRVSRVPAWIKRHAGAPGSIRFSGKGDEFSVYIVNAVRFGRSAQLQRIVPYALRAAALGMRAQAKHVTLKAMKKAGFTVSAALASTL